MCAGAVGEHLEDQVKIYSEEHEDADINDEQEQEVLNGLYEAVYPQYRK